MTRRTEKITIITREPLNMVFLNTNVYSITIRDEIARTISRIGMNQNPP